MKRLYFLIFLEGFTVLALQILTSVLVTPFWGNTFMFWSLELCFVMLALALGYYLASELYKKNNNINKLLTRILFTSYTYILLLFIFSDVLLRVLIGFVSSPISGIIFSLFFFIFIPVALLATVPVIIVIYQKRTFSINEGMASGFVFSISSLAGIFAVLLLSFLCLPIYGIKISLIIVVLVFTLLLLCFFKIIRNQFYLIMVVGIAVLTVAVLFKQRKNAGNTLNAGENIRVKETMYGVLGELKVVEDYNRAAKFLYVNNVPQSKAHLTGRSLYSYVFSLAMYASYKPKGSKVLLAGMGAGSLVYEISQFGYDLDVVDIDPRLLGLAKKHFLLPQKKFNFINSDIRRYIKKNQSKKYDVIILDLSIGESVPTNVFTLECFKECKNMLNEKGIILIHFLSSLSSEGKKSLACISKTLNKAGLENRIMNRLNQKNIYDGIEDIEKPDAYIFIAGHTIDLMKVDFIIDPNVPKELIPDKNNLYLQFNDEDGVILTDDKPILDVLQQKNVINLRKLNVDEMKKSIDNGKN